MLSHARQFHIYLAIKECNEESGAHVEAACELLDVSRAAYYRLISEKNAPESYKMRR